MCHVHIMQKLDGNANIFHNFCSFCKILNEDEIHANFCSILATSFIKGITLLNSVEKLTTFHAKMLQILGNCKR